MAGNYTCGARISWLMSTAGGNLSDAAARTRVAAEFPMECGDCPGGVSISVTTTSTTTTTTTPASTSASATASPSPAPTPPTPASTTSAPVATPTTPTPSPTIEGCEENMAQGHSCGDRIAWLMSPVGGSLSDSAARTRVAAEFPLECGACPSGVGTTVTATTSMMPTTASVATTLSPIQSSLVLDPCGTSQPWQGDRALASVQDFMLEGRSIRSDAWLSMCKDCAARCWLQMTGECVGFTWEAPSNAPAGLGRCTYFSEVDRFVSSAGNTIVTTVSVASAHGA